MSLVSVVHLLLIVGVFFIVALYLEGRLHSVGHVVTEAVLRTTMKGTQRIICSGSTKFGESWSTF